MLFDAVVLPPIGSPLFRFVRSHLIQYGAPVELSGELWGGLGRQPA